MKKMCVIVSLLLLASCVSNKKEKSLASSVLEITEYHRSIRDPFQPTNFQENAVEFPAIKIGDHRVFLPIKMSGLFFEVVSEKESSVTIRCTIPRYRNIIVTYIFKDDVLDFIVRT